MNLNISFMVWKCYIVNIWRYINQMTGFDPPMIWQALHLFSLSLIWYKGLVGYYENTLFKQINITSKQKYAACDNRYKNIPTHTSAFIWPHQSDMMEINGCHNASNNIKRMFWMLWFVEGKYWLIEYTDFRWYLWYQSGCF